MINIINLKYPGIQGVTYWHTRYDGTPWAHPYDGLVWENKDIPKPTKSQIATWKNEFDLQVRQQEVAIKRQQEYANQGITAEAVSIAILEKIVENRPEALNELQAKRIVIKQAYPKPTE